MEIKVVSTMILKSSKNTGHGALSARTRMSLLTAVESRMAITFRTIVCIQPHWPLVQRFYLLVRWLVAQPAYCQSEEVVGRKLWCISVGLCICAASASSSPLHSS